MSVSTKFTPIRKLNLPKKRGIILTSAIVPIKRPRQSHKSIVFQGSSSDSSFDSNINHKMYQKFLEELLETKKSQSNWFTKRVKQYKERGILNSNVLKQIEEEEEEIDDDLQRNEQEIKHKAWIRKYLNKLICNCSTHLNTWHFLFVDKLHSKRSFLECQVPTEGTNEWKEKANQVARYVDFECGLDEYFDLYLGYRQPPERQIFLAISKTQVIGCIIAEPASKASYLKKDGDVETVDDECVVKCCINKIWVQTGFRRKKVASALFRIVQSWFMVNEKLREKDFAFSTITDDGLLFANALLKTQNIPICTESLNQKNRSKPSYRSSL